MFYNHACHTRTISIYYVSEKSFFSFIMLAVCGMRRAACGGYNHACYTRTISIYFVSEKSFFSFNMLAVCGVRCAVCGVRWL